jgi:SP family galactose:H+ symporter-like MFS transporter
MNERCTAFLLFVVCIAALGGFLFGYHTGVIAGALVYLAPAFHLTIAQQGMVVSMMLIGALFGSLFAGVLADRLGRKRTIAITAVFFIIGAILIALAQSYEMVLLGRAVGGLGLGIVALSAPMYLAEVSPSRFRGAFVSFYQLAIALGILASFAVNYAFSSHADWRWMFAMGIFPALFQLAALFFLPESPSWLVKRGHHEHAISVFERLRKDRAWMHQIEEMRKTEGVLIQGSWKALWTPKMRFVLVLGIIISACQQITGINTVIYYAPKIFQAAGFASATGAILATLGIGIINVFATIVAVWLLDKAGRRRLLLVGTAGMSVALSLLVFAFLFSSKAIDRISVICLMGYVSFFSIGLGPVTWVVISEIYPMKLRGKAMTAATFVNWCCNYLVSLTFLDLISGMGLSGTFAIYALISMASFWFFWRYLPETKGKSLEEIERHLIR